MRSLRELVLILIGILFMLLLCAGWSNVMRAGALGEDWWFYSFRSEAFAYWGTDSQTVEDLLTSATLESVDVATISLQPASWQFYTGRWFVNGRLVIQFTFNANTPQQACMLVTMNEPELVHVDSAVMADCAILEEFHKQMIGALLETVPEATETPSDDL